MLFVQLEGCYVVSFKLREYNDPLVGVSCREYDDL